MTLNYSRLAVWALLCLAGISVNGHAGVPVAVTANTCFEAPAAVHVVPATDGQQVVSLSLMNADTEQEIRTITAGEVLNLAVLPTRNLNVRVNTSPAVVGSVVMSLSGSLVRAQTETSAPYALFGDVSGNYNAWTPAPGSYSLTATPYTAAGGTGTAGTPLTLSFSVIDQSPARKAMPGSHFRQERNGVRVSPNPVVDEAAITFTPAEAGEVALDLSTVRGERVKQLYAGRVEAGEKQTVILKSEGLRKGVYLLRLTAGKKAFFMKLVLVR